MLATRHSVFAELLLVTSAAFVTARGQTTSTADARLSLKAALLLTPEFCATIVKEKFGNGLGETLEVGKAACAELEPALKVAFSGLARVIAAPFPEDAQVVLLPRVVDVRGTQPRVFSN